MSYSIIHEDGAVTDYRGIVTTEIVVNVQPESVCGQAIAATVAEVNVTTTAGE